MVTYCIVFWTLEILYHINIYYCIEAIASCRENYSNLFLFRAFWYHFFFSLSRGLFLNFSLFRLGGATVAKKLRSLDCYRIEYLTLACAQQ